MIKINLGPKKTCTLCGESKYLGEYSSQRVRGGAYKSAYWCKQCCIKNTQEANKRYEKTNTENPPSDDGDKRCNECLLVKPKRDFFRCVSKKDGFSFQCKVCSKIRADQWISKNKIRWKDSRRAYANKNKRATKDNTLRKQYGITIEEYERMLVVQEYLCAICGKKGSLNIDHDHKTGKVRALLCGRCNPALGSFMDSLEILLKAVEYLKKHS